MATPLTNKIVLKNTTKMSLNERFTVYRNQARINSTAVEYRDKMQRATSKNLRLAQQMVNRPSVIAALRLKKKSMQQRLGRPFNQQQSNVKSRLTFAKSFLNTNDNGPVHNRLGIVRGRGGRRGMNRGRFRPGTSPLIRARLGQLNNVNFNFARPSQRNNRPMRGRGGNNRFQGQRNVRNFNNNRGRGRGNARGGRFQRNTGPPPSKQELDNQLDEYMAAHTGVLDAQQFM